MPGTFVAAFFHQQPSLKLKLCGVTGTERQNDDDLPAQAHLRTGHAALRPHRDGALRDRRRRSSPVPTPRRNRSDLQALLGADARRGLQGGGDGSVLARPGPRPGSAAWEFDAAVFTNLTQDHLDFHGSFQESYFEAKAVGCSRTSAAAARRRNAGVAVINIDDRYGAELVHLAAAEKRASDHLRRRQPGGFPSEQLSRPRPPELPISLTRRNAAFLVRLPLIGRFNIYNSLAALAAASAMGVHSARRSCRLPRRRPSRVGCNWCRPSAVTRSTWITRTPTTP